MAERLRWWVIPGALLVLARVVTLADPSPATESAADPLPAAHAMPVPAVALAERAVLQDASGARTGPRALPAQEQAFVLQAPTTAAGQRGELVLWQRVDGGRDPRPWLTAKVTVRDDGTLPMAGIRPGHYDVELRLADAVLQGRDVTAPGAVVLVPGAAAPTR